MKLLLCLALAPLPLFGAGCLDASAQAAAPAFPAASPQVSRLAFEKTAIELGEIYQFENIPFEFPFSVEGSEPVIISRVESNCGCTDYRIRADWEMQAPGADPSVEKLYVYGREIPPGARATVMGTFTSERRFGDKSTIITLHGNFANSPMKLDIHTSIRRIFEVKPAQVRFGDVLAGVAGSAAPQEVTIVGRSPFEIVQWKRLPPGIKIEPVGEPKATGHKDETARTFRVTLGPDAPEGVLSTSCIAETSIKLDLEIMVLANVNGPVRYTPGARIAFGMVPMGEERPRTIEIESSLPSVKLPEPTVELEGEALRFLKVSVETVEAGRMYRVRLTLPATNEAAILNGLVRIKYPAGSGIVTREFPITGRVIKSGGPEPK